MSLVAVTVEDIKARFPEYAADDTFTETLIEDAFVLLSARYPLMESWLATGRVSPDLIKWLVVQAVLRVLRNETAGLTGIYDSESDADYSYKVNSRVASAGLWWPEDELGLLPTKTSAKNVRAGTIPLIVPGLYRRP